MKKFCDSSSLGWTGQRIQTINVDIVVEPGWSCVPLSLIDELKVTKKFPALNSLFCQLGLDLISDSNA